MGLAGYRRRADTGARASIVIAAIVASVVVLVFFAMDTLRNDPATFVAIVVIAALAVALDYTWKRRRPTAAVTSDASELPAPRR